MPEVKNFHYDKTKTLVSMFNESVTKYGENDAFSCMGSSLTFNELDEKSSRMASWLQKQTNLRRGAKVAIMMPNLLQYPIALYGVLKAGMSVVSVNPLYTAAELRHQLQDSKAQAIIILENFAHVLESSGADLPIVLTTEIGDELSPFKKIVTNFVVKNIKKLVPNYYLPDAISWQDAFKSTPDPTYRIENIDQNSIAFLQYTGGTTGRAKGAILTHGNMVANTFQVIEYLSDQPEFANKCERNGDVLTALPLYHIFSLLANCILISYLGGHNVLIPNPRDTNGLIKEMQNYKFFFITGVNTLLHSMTTHKHFKKVDLSSLLITMGGGMPVRKDTSNRWKEFTGNHIIEAYGLTETSPAVCINPSLSTDFKGSIGIAIPGTALRICDDDGNDVGQGETGELWVKGPQVFQGYLNLPDETKNAITSDGFFKTGDIAKIDNEGFVYIVDRKKDMILVSGFNVFPNEIEEALSLHPDIAEVACIGVPDDRTGEAVKAYVVLVKGGKMTPKELITYGKETLTAYKVPRDIEFIEELPKSNVGKILRKDLRG